MTLVATSGHLVMMLVANATEHIVAPLKNISPWAWLVCPRRTAVVVGALVAPLLLATMKGESLMLVPALFQTPFVSKNTERIRRPISMAVV